MDRKDFSGYAISIYFVVVVWFEYLIDMLGYIGINIAVDLEYQHMPKFTTTVGFGNPSNENASNSATHQTYRALVEEERQRKELESEDALI